jgi:hypothetical protein
MREWARKTDREEKERRRERDMLDRKHKNEKQLQKKAFGCFIT